MLAKILSQDVVIVEDLSLAEPKTSVLRSMLEALQANTGCVLALESPHEGVYRSSRNIPRTEVTPVADLNAFGVLRRKKLIFTKPAFEAFTARAAQEFSK